MHLWKRTERLHPYNCSWMTLRALERGTFSRKKLAVNFQVQACRIFRLLILVAVVYVEPKYAKMRFLMLAQYVNGNPICYHVWFSKIVHVCFDLSESPDPVVKILQTELAWSRGRWVCDNFSVYSLVLFFFHPLSSSYSFVASSQFQLLQKTVLIPDLDTWGYPDRTSTRHELLRHSSDIWRPPGHELSRRIASRKGTSWPWRRFGNTHLWTSQKNSHLQSIGGVQAALEFVLSMSFCGSRTSTSWLLPSPVSAQNPWCTPCLYFQGVQHDNSSKSKMQDRTDLLLQRQIPVARAPNNHPLQMSAFIPGTWQPVTDKYVRRVGRPRREWVTEVRTKNINVWVVTWKCPD